MRNVLFVLGIGMRAQLFDFDIIQLNNSANVNNGGNYEKHMYVPDSSDPSMKLLLSSGRNERAQVAFM